MITTALTKDKLLFVLGFLGNHGDPIPISYIQCLYDKYGDTYDFGTDKYELISENRYWCDGWQDKNGTFKNNFQMFKMEIRNGKRQMNEKELKKYNINLYDLLGALIEYGQHDKQFKLGDTIKYDPVSVVKIAKEFLDR